MHAWFYIVFLRKRSHSEATLLLVSTKNRDLWPGPTPEVRDSRTSRHSAHAQSQVWQIRLVLASIYCVYKAIQNRDVVGRGQRSRFLVLTKRSATSVDKNVLVTVGNVNVIFNTRLLAFYLKVCCHFCRMRDQTLWLALHRRFQL